MKDKTLHNTDSNTAQKNVPDIVKFGDPDRFQLVCKASSQDEGWMKSTKAMNTATGCVVQVTTQQMTGGPITEELREKFPGVTRMSVIAEAVTFMPGEHFDKASGRFIQIDTTHSEAALKEFRERP